MMNTQPTDSELIEQLGGGTEVAQALSSRTGQPVDREAVYKWKERNFIPWKWRHHMDAMAKERAGKSDEAA